MGLIKFTNNTTTSEEFGKNPNDRNIEERLASGFILLDKPTGPTSHQIAAWVRDELKMERLGHGGTLDPFATGVLPLMAGKTMRLTHKVLTHDKTYIAVFKFSKDVEQDIVEEALTHLRGRIYNVPPEISAVKVQVRSRRIEKFDVLERNGKHMVAEIACEAGTYVRTLARDLGLLIGQNVELVELRRSASGQFNLAHCVTLQQVADAIWRWREMGDDSAMMRIVHPVEHLVNDLPSIIIKDSAAAALSHGAPLARPGIVAIDGGWTKGSTMVAKTLKGEVVALVTLSVDATKIKPMKEGEVAKPEIVLMEADTYPRLDFEPR